VSEFRPADQSHLGIPRWILPKKFELVNIIVDKLEEQVYSNLDSDKVNASWFLS
jgi:hypothetical protein